MSRNSQSISVTDASVVPTKTAIYASPHILLTIHLFSLLVTNIALQEKCICAYLSMCGSDRGKMQMLTLTPTNPKYSHISALPVTFSDYIHQWSHPNIHILSVALTSKINMAFPEKFSTESAYTHLHYNVSNIKFWHNPTSGPGRGYSRIYPGIAHITKILSFHSIRPIPL